MPNSFKYTVLCVEFEGMQFFLLFNIVHKNFDSPLVFNGMDQLITPTQYFSHLILNTQNPTPMQNHYFHLQIIAFEIRFLPPRFFLFFPPFLLLRCQFMHIINPCSIAGCPRIISIARDFVDGRISRSEAVARMRDQTAAGPPQIEFVQFEGPLLIKGLTRVTGFLYLFFILRNLFLPDYPIDEKVTLAPHLGSRVKGGEGPFRPWVCFIFYFWF